MRILTLVSHYLPGYKSGGPIRTISGMVQQLGDTFDFWILTADRDFQDKEAYAGIPVEQWVAVGGAQVFYTDVRFLSLHKMSALIQEMQPAVIYLNSLFSTLSNRYLLARRLRMIPNIPTIAAPRGVFSPGALQLKRRKKALYLRTANLSGLFNALIWQASSKLEKGHILSSVRGIGERDVYIAPNITGYGIKDAAYGENSGCCKKTAGCVRFLFLSRVSAKKNLNYALKLLAQLEGNIELDVYGPVEDPSHWTNCEQIIAEMPNHVTVHVHGSVPYEAVAEILGNGHFLLLPTLGENFGHVVFEALQAGCPPIISDRTPWNDLEDFEAGRVIPLENRKRWIETLQYCIDMDQDDFANYSTNAKQYALRWLSTSQAVEANRKMFLTTADQV